MYRVCELIRYAHLLQRDGCTFVMVSPLSLAGGNAGLAAAYIAHELGLPITVVVPQTTPSFIVEKLREEGATVEVVGKVRRRPHGSGIGTVHGGRAVFALATDT